MIKFCILFCIIIVPFYHIKSMFIIILIFLFIYIFKYIFDINDKENPVLQLGINNGLMMAAERLLESNMSIDKVVILLRLDANQEKILRMKYGR